jgi:hypothetical protein
MTADVTATAETVDEVSVSRKREVTAVVVTTVVSIALGLGANIIIGKVGQRVHDRIVKTNPDQITWEETAE